MYKLSAVLVSLLLLVGLGACGDDKEGNADALASNCQTSLDQDTGSNVEVPTEDICRCYGDTAAEQYSTDELNDLLKKGNEQAGREALAPILVQCASDNGVDLTDSDAPDDGTSGADGTDTGS